MQQGRLLPLVAAAAVVLMTQLPSCRGHAYLMQPVARNWLYAHTEGFYNEMSLNRIGTGVCGGQQLNDSRFQVAPIPPTSPLDGMFAQGVITANYTEGQEIPIRIHMATSHWGRFELRLCPLSDPSLVTENKQLSEACLAKYPLYLAPGSFQKGLSDPTKTPGENYYYFTVADQTAADVYTSFMLPPGVTCTRCVLQWRWVTGNSCYAPGTNVTWQMQNTPMLPACDPSNYLTATQLPPEKFWNCADIGIAKRTTAAAPPPPKPPPRPPNPPPQKSPPPSPPAREPPSPPNPPPMAPQKSPPYAPSTAQLFGQPPPRTLPKSCGGKCATVAPKKPPPPAEKVAAPPPPTTLPKACGGKCATVAPKKPPPPRKLLPPPPAKTPTKAPTTAPTAAAPTAAAATPTSGGLTVAPLWGQCGGQYGNPAFTGDVEWTDTICTTGTVCVRYSADYWQCRPPGV